MKEVARSVRASGQMRQGRLQLVVSRRAPLMGARRLDKRMRLHHPGILWLSVISAIALAAALAATVLAVGLTLLVLSLALTITIGLFAAVFTLVERTRRRPRSD